MPRKHSRNALNLHVAKDIDATSPVELLRARELALAAWLAQEVDAAAAAVVLPTDARARLAVLADVASDLERAKSSLLRVCQTATASLRLGRTLSEDANAHRSKVLTLAKRKTQSG
jgi:hypothetical protein